MLPSLPAEKTASSAIMVYWFYVCFNPPNDGHHLKLWFGGLSCVFVTVLLV